MQAALLFNALFLYASLAYAANPMDMASLDWVSIAISSGLGSVGSVTMLIAQYGDDEMTKAELARRMLPAAAIGITVGGVAYGLANYVQVQLWTSFLWSWTGGLAAREVLPLLKAFGGKIGKRGI